MEELRNIGPVSAGRLAAVGIDTRGDLERVGALAAYLLVKERFPEQTSLNLLYSLEGALLDVPWHQLPEALMERLRVAAMA